MSPNTPGPVPKMWRRPQRRPLPGPIGRAARAVLGPPLKQTEPNHRVEFVHLLTRHFRLLPDFLIIGTQRGGTTSLYHYLQAHPSVYAAATKDTHFFDKKFHKGVGWYRAHFPDYPRARRALIPFIW